MCVGRSRFRAVAIFVLMGLMSLPFGCGADRTPLPTAQPLAHPAQQTPWRFAGVKGRKLSTDHYDVFTTTDSPGLQGGIAGFMEAARAHYVELTGLDPLVNEAVKLKVYLFGSRGEWAALTEKITGAAADTVLRVQAGGYCYRGVCVFWDIGALPTYSVAAHEGLHQFMHHATRESLPQWAEEGLATQAEGFKVANGLVTFEPRRNLSRLNTLRNTILGDRWRPALRLAAMTSMDNIEESPFAGGEYYGQLWALMLMIRNDETYNAGLRRLCRDAAAGRLGEALGFPRPQWVALQRKPAAYTAVVGPRVLVHYFDADLERFESKYRAYARQLAKLR